MHLLYTVPSLARHCCRWACCLQQSFAEQDLLWLFLRYSSSPCLSVHAWFCTNDGNSIFLMYLIIHDFLCLLPFFPWVLWFLPAPRCISTKSAYNANSACFIHGSKMHVPIYRCVKTRQEAEYFFFSVAAVHWQIWSYFLALDTKITTHKGIKFMSGWFVVAPSTLTIVQWFTFSLTLTAVNL